MKKNLAAILFLLFAISAFSQNKTKDFYLQKSKNQKTVFYVFATTDTEYYTGGFIAAGGFAALAISIPFFTASLKNKRKAISISFKNETAPQIQSSRFVYKSVPSLTLKVCL